MEDPVGGQTPSVDMSDLTGQFMLNDICLGGCGNERRTTLSAKTIACVGLVRHQFPFEG